MVVVSTHKANDIVVRLHTGKSLWNLAIGGDSSDKSHNICVKACNIYGCNCSVF